MDGSTYITYPCGPNSNLTVIPNQTLADQIYQCGQNQGIYDSRYNSGAIRNVKVFGLKTIACLLVLLSVVIADPLDIAQASLADPMARPELYFSQLVQELDHHDIVT